MLLEEKFTAWEDELTDEQRKPIENEMPIHLLVLNRTHGTGHPDIKNWYYTYFMNIQAETAK